MTSRELQTLVEELGQIARHFPPHGPEAETLERAAYALLFLVADDTRSRFVTFMKKREQPLTASQKLHLHAIGIDPETFENTDI